MKLADILRKAAHEHLWSGVGLYLHSPLDHREFSCVAVAAACEALDMRDAWPARIHMYDLGCPMGSGDAELGCDHGPDRQGARFMWLLFAAHFAEDEGVEV